MKSVLGIRSTKASSKEIIAWLLYDVSDTVFSLFIVTLIYAVYFKHVVVDSGNKGDFIWGLNIAISISASAVAAPVLGAIADSLSRRKLFLSLFAFSCSIFTGFLYLVNKGDILLGSAIFILANASYALSLTFYNSMLIDVSERKDMGKVSGIGWAVGYAGALLCLPLIYPLVKGGMDTENIPYIRATFLVAGLLFLIFALPLILCFRERKGALDKENKSYILDGITKTYNTLLNVKNYKNLALFLLSYFFYNDGIATVIVFSSIFASTTLGFSLKELILFFFVIQIAALLGSLFFGYLVDIIGAKRIITVTLIIWCGVIMGTYFVTSGKGFFLIGIFAGAAMGACQSASRSLMGLFTPEERSAEFFGFYSLCSRFSSVLGPFTFGIVSVATQSQRKAVLSISLFFLIGLGILQKVDAPLAENGRLT